MIANPSDDELDLLTKDNVIECLEGQRMVDIHIGETGVIQTAEEENAEGLVKQAWNGAIDDCIKAVRGMPCPK